MLPPLLWARRKRRKTPLRPPLVHRRLLASRWRWDKRPPDFVLPRADGGTLRLSQFLGRQNVVISFVPAAWTPVCSEQWPGYNLAQDQFEARKTVVLGISVDNTPTLFAWTEAMGGVWFPVASDFWPHGKVSAMYGVLREDGTSERALFVIDKKGIIRYLAVYEMEQLPDLEELMAQLDKLR